MSISKRVILFFVYLGGLSATAFFLGKQSAINAFVFAGITAFLIVTVGEWISNRFSKR